MLTRTKYITHMELLNALNIRPEFVLPQLINFLIIAFVLYKFGYKPILKFVQDRTEKIEQGVQNAEKAMVSLENAKEESEHLIAEAHKEAQSIITAAAEKASEQANVVAEQKKEELRQIVLKAKQHIQEEKEKILRETREQAVDLVIAATEKLMHEKMDTEKDKKLVEQALKEVT